MAKTYESNLIRPREIDWRCPFFATIRRSRDIDSDSENRRFLVLQVGTNRNRANAGSGVRIGGNSIPLIRIPENGSGAPFLEVPKRTYCTDPFLCRIRVWIRTNGDFDVRFGFYGSKNPWSHRLFVGLPWNTSLV